VEIAKKRKMQKIKVEFARKKMQKMEFGRKMDCVRNRICKKYNLQRNRPASKGYRFINNKQDYINSKLHFSTLLCICNLKINLQTL